MNLNTILLGMLGPGEWVVIILIVVLLFGGRKIPEMMKGLGQGITEFKKATKKAKKEIEDSEKNDEVTKSDLEKKGESSEAEKLKSEKE